MPVLLIRTFKNTCDDNKMFNKGNFCRITVKKGHTLVFDILGYYRVEGKHKRRPTYLWEIKFPRADLRRLWATDVLDLVLNSARII